MAELSSADVGRFFGEVWRYYCSEPMSLELVRAAPGAPFQAVIAWDWARRRWAIVAEKRAAPDVLFHRLAHELGHVQLGHVARSGGGAADVQRRVMLGQGNAAELGAMIGTALGSWKTAAGLKLEAAAESFAVEVVRAWYPTLRDWAGDVERACAVVRWVTQNERRRVKNGKEKR